MGLANKLEEMRKEGGDAWLSIWNADATKVSVCVCECVHVCMCVCVYIINVVGSCLATKVFTGTLPATGRGWVIIK